MTLCIPLLTIGVCSTSSCSSFPSAAFSDLLAGVSLEHAATSTVSLSTWSRTSGLVWSEHEVMLRSDLRTREMLVYTTPAVFSTLHMGILHFSLWASISHNSQYNNTGTMLSSPWTLRTIMDRINAHSTFQYTSIQCALNAFQSHSHKITHDQHIPPCPPEFFELLTILCILELSFKDLCTSSGLSWEVTW